VLPECLHSPVFFAFQGKKWRLLFTHRVLLSCEALTGVDMLAANLGNPPAALVRALLFCALERAGAGCTIDLVGRLITARSLRSIRIVVLEAWRASMPDPKPAPAKPKDPKDSDGGPEKLTWMKAWAEAVSQDGLGLSEEQWLEQTPRQTGALEDLLLEQRQREELLCGIIASTMANYGYRAPDKPRTSESFMLHPFAKKKPGPVTGDDIQREMRKLRKA